MNSPYDDDAFAMQFDDAVNEMHGRHPASPGTTIRQQLDTRLSQTSITRGTPRSSQGKASQDWNGTHIYQGRGNDMDTSLATPTRGHITEPSRGVSAWIAAAMVVMLVASGLYLNTLRPGSNQQFAWAPATPGASPVPGYACDVTPLTTDEVMAIIFNPQVGYETRGQDHIDADYTDLSIEFEPSNKDQWTTVTLSSVINPEIAADMQAFGNTFWNCLISGTSFQIWAMMDPAMLQWSILKAFPVVRSEDDLRGFVEEFGPRPYKEAVNDISAYGIFPSFLNQNPDDVAKVADTAIPATRLSSARGEGNQATSIGVITMRPVNSDDPYDYVELYVSNHPDGSWTVHWTMPNLNLTKG